MVSPRDSLQAISLAVANAGELPAETSVLLEEADEESDNADIDLPLLEMRIDNVDNVVVSNTDFVGVKKDSNGNEVGRIYRSEYEMTVDMNIWTAANNDTYSPDDLGEKLRSSLYQHSSYGPDDPFVDEDGNTITDITYFRLGDGERTDDLVQSPTVRKWSQEAELWAYESFNTDKDYIVSVDYPSGGGT